MSIVVEEPNLEVLRSTTAALGMESIALSFRWAMGARFIQKWRMVITMIWREWGTAIQERRANTLMSKSPQSSR